MTRWLNRFFFLFVALGISHALTAQTSLLDSVIKADSLKKLVYILAADSFCGRYTGTTHATDAADFIAGEFKKAGVETIAGNREYFMTFPFMSESEKGEGLNVMGMLPGRSKSKELIIFSAHYDHAGTKSNVRYVLPITTRRDSNDTIYNGANDNASGVSGLIALARYFGMLKNNERTILFIAFAGEEEGLAGSRALAQTINAKNVKAMINMDMIGRGITDSSRDAYITGSDLSDLQAILNNQLFENAPKVYGKKFFKDDPFTKQALFSRSDNYWFANRSICAHTIMVSSPVDRYFHSVNDEADKLNYPLMTRVVKAIALGCTGLVNGTQTPSSIDKDHIPPSL